MEPLRRDVRQAILDANPNATNTKIDEYEALLSRRFSANPDDHSDEALKEQQEREQRLAELDRELFPGKRRA